MGRVYFDKAKGQGAYRIGNYANLVDGDILGIGDKNYEFDDNGAVGAGNVKVTIGGSNSATATNLKGAINTTPPTHPVVATIDTVDDATVNFVATYGGPAGNLAIVDDTTGGSNLPSGAVMTGGESDGNQKIARGEYIVTAIDEDAGRVRIETSRASPRFPQIVVKTDDGEIEVPVTGNWEVVGSALVYTFDDASGGVNPDEDDVVTWLVFE